MFAILVNIGKDSQRLFGLLSRVKHSQRKLDEKEAGLYSAIDSQMSDNDENYE